MSAEDEYTHPYQIDILVYHEYTSYTCCECEHTVWEGVEIFNEEECPECLSGDIVYWCDLCGEGFDHIYSSECDQSALDDEDKSPVITYDYKTIKASKSKLHADLKEYKVEVIDNVNDFPEVLISMIASYL